MGEAEHTAGPADDLPAEPRKMWKRMAGNLRRELGLVEAIATGLGAIVGAGLFVVLGIAAGVAGPALLLGLLISGIGATCNALTSAELAALYPRSGGTYEYANRLLGPWAGFAAGWMFLASKLAAAGTVALGFGGYVGQLFPAADPRWLGVGAALSLTALNLFGIQKAGTLNLGIVTITLAGLTYLVVSLMPQFRFSNLVPFAPYGFPRILEAAALLFFAYTGYARLATLGEEVRNPAATIPRAVTASVWIAILLYLAVALAALGSVGAAALAESGAPLERAARSGVLPYTGTIIVLAGATAMLGVLLSQILGISRMIFAMARGGDLPGVLVKTNAHDVPARAILLSGAVLLAVAWFGKLELAASGASFAILLYYALANASSLRLPRDKRRFPLFVPWTGLIFCVGLCMFLEARVILAGLGLLAAGLAGRAISKAFRSHKALDGA